jgi:hypothetical protein
MTDARAEQTLNRVLNKVPGYSGYRDKENRRDADRLVRDRLVAELSQRAERVERIALRAADERRILDVGPLNDIAGAIRHLSDRINTATYGYGGLFGNKDVDATVLDQIRLFDESLFAGLEQIDPVLSTLEGAGGDSLADAAGQARQFIEQMTDRLDQRARIFESAAPASPVQMSNVLAVLQTPEELREAQAPQPAYELHDRDALAVLGENFVVDARIDVESANGFFRLFRVNAGPDRWLFVPRQRGQTLALLSATAEPYVPGPPATIGADSYTVELSGHGSGEVTGAGGQTGRRPLSYSLLRGSSEPSLRAVVLQWGAEQQIYSGREVHPDDVEIFGRPT